jgi:N-acetylmuramoyl-L-alanine amidase
VGPIFSQAAKILQSLINTFVANEIKKVSSEKNEGKTMECENRYMWLIDHGHGESTPGKRSPKFEDGTQLREYLFNRRVSKYLMEMLDENNVCYHNLVPEVEKDIKLSERVARANNVEADMPKILISIHGNAFGSDWTSPSGIETYYCKGSAKGETIAHVFQNKIAMETGWKDRGVKTAGFYILKHTSMPAILTENGFFTNKSECKKMMTDEWCQKIASAHFDAIMEIESEGL